MHKIIFCIALLLSTAAHAEEWRQQKSDHFTIIYNAKQRQLATYYLSIAEKVYSELLPVFKEAPENTYLVLTDYFDYSNGAATVFPQPTVYLFPHLPDTNDTIENHSSWAYMLLKHEYTHILNMYPHNGGAKILHGIFGAWVKPNMFLPNWYLEGLAVERESDDTNRFGRLNSPYYQGLLRAYVLEGQLAKESIDRYASFDIPLYPYASRPYFLGSFYWQYLTKTYGEEIIYNLNDAYSRRFPWIIESPLQVETQKSYNLIAVDAGIYFTEKTENEVKTLGAKEHNTANSLMGYFQRNFEVHPSKNEAIYITKDRTGKDEIRHIQFNDPNNILRTITQDQRLARSDKTVRATWSPDGTKILFDRLHTYEGKYQYLDLYTRDIEKKKTEPLTDGRRARDAVYLNDNEVLYVSFDQVFRLQQLNITTQITTTLYEAKLEEKILSPVILNGKPAFILKRPDGYHQVIQIGESKPIYESKFGVSSLSVCQTNLCWIDETTGVANFVTYDTAKKAVSPLTNTRTAVVAATATSTSAIYSEVNVNGAFIVEERRPQNIKLQSLRSTETSPQTWDVALLQPEEDTYYSTLHLYPRYWLPFIYGDENGTYTSIATSANDPATLQNYAIQVGHYSANDKWDKNFSYQNVYWDVLLSLNAYETFEYLESIDDSIQRQRIKFGVTTSLYFINEDLYLNAFIDSEKAGRDNVAQRKAQGAGLSLTYDQSERVAHGGILPEAGYVATLAYSEYFKKEGYFDFKITEGYFAQYLNYFLPDNHVVHYRLAARKSDSNGRPLSLGSVTIGGQEITNDNYTFSIRGYPSGNFLAWSAYFGQLNYTFPLYDVYKGQGTVPIFLKRIYANFVAETLAIDGAYYNKNDTLLNIEASDKTFASYGIELKASSEVMYKFPINWVLGYYFGTSENAGGDDRVYFRFEASLF
jgi:hypothetical protein